MIVDFKRFISTSQTKQTCFYSWNAAAKINLLPGSRWCQTSHRHIQFASCPSWEPWGDENPGWGSGPTWKMTGILIKWSICINPYYLLLGWWVYPLYGNHGLKLKMKKMFLCFYVLNATSCDLDYWSWITPPRFQITQPRHEWTWKTSEFTTVPPGWTFPNGRLDVFTKRGFPQQKPRSYTRRTFPWLQPA